MTLSFYYEVNGKVKIITFNLIINLKLQQGSTANYVVESVDLKHNEFYNGIDGISLKKYNKVFNMVGEDIINCEIKLDTKKSKLMERYDSLIEVLNKYDLYQAPNENNEFIGDEVHLALEDLKEAIKNA